MRYKKLLTLILTLFVLTIACMDCFAEDRKSYPGMMCRVHYEEPERGISFAAFRNSDTNESKKVVCPVVRDKTSTSMDVQSWSVTVKRYRTSVNQLWDISLWSTNKLGVEGYKSVVSVPGLAAGEKITLEGRRINTAHKDGILFIRSDVPPLSRIYSYSVSEN